MLIFCKGFFLALFASCFFVSPSPIELLVITCKKILHNCGHGCRKFAPYSTGPSRWSLNPKLDIIGVLTED